MPGIGTIVNFSTVCIGACIGFLVGHRLPQRSNEIAMQAVGGVVIVIGIQMALSAETGSHMMIVLVSLTAGSLVGEYMGIEKRLTRIGNWLQTRLTIKHKDGTFTKAFVTASLLFCVGPMAILGAIQDGLFANPTLLYTKSALDGISAIMLAASLGIGTLLSAFTVLIYQGLLTLFAHAIQTFMTSEVTTVVTATGGVMILAIGVNIWQLATLRVGNMLPGLLFAALLSYIFI